MTISSETSRVSYTGNDSTDTYAYTFKIFAEDELLVTQYDTNDVKTTLTLTTDYTVTGVGDSTGGNIVLVAGNLTTDYTLIIRRYPDLVQETNIRNQGPYYAATHEDSLDRAVMIDQRLQDGIGRSIKLSEKETSSDFDPELPPLGGNTDQIVPITNAAGDGWDDTDQWPTGDAINGAAASAAAAAVSAAASAAAAGTLSPYGINNMGLSASVAASALTIALKQADGTTDPSTGDDGVVIYFRSTTLTTGSMTARTAVAATSLVIPSGATLGHNDNVQEPIWIYALDYSSGTVELAVSSSSHWDEGQLYTTTALTTGSDDAATLYSTSARTSVPIRKIGRILTTQTTAGTWDAAVTRLDVGFLPGSRQLVMNRAIDFTPKHGIVYNVDTTAARSATLPVAKAGYDFTIKDVDDSRIFPITLTRNGSESIEDAAANYSLSVAKGAWRVTSDGTDWWIRSDADGDNSRSITVFENNSDATLSVPNSYTSFTMPAATHNIGSANVTLSTNEVVFPYTGYWKWEYSLGRLESTDASDHEVMARVRNTTDSVNLTETISHLGGTNGDIEYTASESLIFQVTDLTKAYEIQWISETTASNLTRNNVGGNNSYIWRYIFTYLGT